MNHHTPWTVFSAIGDEQWKAELLSAYGKNWSHVLNQLKQLRSQVAVQLQRDTDSRIVRAWKRIDHTRPTRSINAASYRYPFTDGQHPEGVAPVSWSDWDTYQGKESLVREAVNELLKRAGTQVTIWDRQT